MDEATKKLVIARKLIRLGNSYVVSLPKIVVESEEYCTRLGDEYWVRIDVHDGKIVISKLDFSEFEISSQ